MENTKQENSIVQVKSTKNKKRQKKEVKSKEELFLEEMERDCEALEKNMLDLENYVDLSSGYRTKLFEQKRTYEPVIVNDPLTWFYFLWKNKKNKIVPYKNNDMYCFRCSSGKNERSYCMRESIDLSEFRDLLDKAFKNGTLKKLWKKKSIVRKVKVISSMIKNRIREREKNSEATAVLDVKQEIPEMLNVLKKLTIKVESMRSIIKKSGENNE